MRRRGFTLLEMLIAVTAGSVMLGIAVAILHVLLRAEQTGRERVHQTQVVSRLAEQFRSDMNAAVGQIPDRDARPKQWQFAMDDNRSVTYEALPGEVQRDERAAGKVVRQETYKLPEGFSATLKIAQYQANPAEVDLVISREPTPLASGREVRVVARLGMDHRFSKQPVGGQ